jgi:hypothetical protein
VNLRLPLALLIGRRFLVESLLMLGCYLLLLPVFCGWLEGNESSPIAVEVKTTLSTRAVEGVWVSIDERQLLVEVGQGEQSIPLQALQSIRFPGLSSAPTQAGRNLLVILRDGSQIFPESLTSDGRAVSMRFGQNFQLQIPTVDIHSVRLQQLTVAQQTQWEAILDSRITGDNLVLARSPESLDTVEGLVGSIGEETIQFDFGDQRLNAPRARLAGVRFFNPPAEISKVMGTAVDLWGNRWNLSKVGYETQSGLLDLALAGGTSVKIPIEQIQSIDFSAGSIQFLADLTPIGRGRQTGLELGIDSQVMEALFGPQAYQIPKTSGPSLRFSGSSWVTYRVPPEYTRLAGTLYLAPSGNRFTACRVEVRLENEVVWAQELTQLSQRLDLSLPVEADKRIRLSVTAQDDFPVGDIVIWQELRFLK